MSHDIRTPMNAIIGFTSLAATHIDNREQVLDYLKKTATASQHLLSLINDVLDMSRIESGKVSLELRPVQLPELVHDLRDIIQPSITAKRISLFIDMVDVEDENVVADPCASIRSCSTFCPMPLSSPGRRHNHPAHRSEADRAAWQCGL